MITYYNKLKAKIKEKFGDRKERGLICLFYNAKKQAFIPIPTEKEHIDIASEILSKTKKEIEKNPDLSSHLIPINIFLKENKITEVIVGISGLEMGYKVKHSREDLIKAHEASWNFVRDGDFELSPKFKRVLKTDYVK